VVDGRVTEILDLESIVRLSDPNFFENQSEVE
jgi:hypothetical protein